MVPASQPLGSAPSTTSASLKSSRLPIGIFDSGVGGLTVWRELRRQLPHESLVYLGDTARVPYGRRSATEIQQFAHEIIHWMIEHPVKMIVMACNTSSALALEALQPDCPVPLLGTILPGARAAVQKGSRIGVLATPATVASHAYLRAIQESSLDSGWVTKPDRKFVSCWEQSCPEFVPLIESDQLDSPLLRKRALEYLQPLLDQQIDTLVYGCTHYPLLEPVLRLLLPDSVCLVDPAVALVAAIAQELDLWELKREPQLEPQLDSGKALGTTHFCVTGDPEIFADLAIRWLGARPDVSQVHLQKISKRSLA